MTNIKGILVFLLVSLIVSGNAFGEYFRLKEVSVIFNDGIILTSKSYEVSVTGAMTIDGSFFSQAMTLCINGECASGEITGTISGIGGNEATADLTVNSGTSRVAIISGDPLITHMMIPGQFTEVDVWEPIDPISRNYWNGGYTQKSKGDNAVEAPFGLLGGTLADNVNSQ